MESTLYQIKPVYYPNFQVGDIIDINGENLSGHGERIYNILKQRPYKYKDVLDFIKFGADISDERIDEISGLCILDIGLSKISKELILEKVRRTIDDSLPSRFYSIFLSSKKEIHKWVDKLNAKDRPIYELEIIKEQKIHNGDEWFWIENTNMKINAINFWTKSGSKGKNHLYEIVFQGQLKVKKIFTNFDEYKTILDLLKKQ